jgi:hypothetical protein
MFENVCLSGGAKGADHAWGICAEDAGHSIIHWSFSNHNTIVRTNLVELTKEQLLEADPRLIKASKSLKRPFKGDYSKISNLLRRSWYQVSMSDRIYAVANIIEDKSLMHVSGGTAWAIQLYLDRTIEENISPEIYMFEQHENVWLKWNDEWEQIDKPPVPHGIYAGIGSRDITISGLEAIASVYG